MRTVVTLQPLNGDMAETRPHALGTGIHAIEVSGQLVGIVFDGYEHDWIKSWVIGYGFHPTQIEMFQA